MLFRISNSLTDINFSDNITFIDDNAFWECTSLLLCFCPKVLLVLATMLLPVVQILRKYI